MEFIKNINSGKFVINNIDIIKRVFNINYKLPQLENAIYKVTDVDMSGADFALVSADNIDEIAGLISAAMITEAEREVKKYKTVCNKIIKEWKNNPSAFKYKTKNYQDQKVYTHNTLLTDNEYHQSIYVSFDNLDLYYGRSFTTGNGGETFYDLEYYEELLVHLDKWVNSEIKKFKTSKVKKRIINYIKKATIELSYYNIIKDVTILEKNIIIKSKTKPRFPFNIDGNDLNNLIYTLDEGVIDNDILNKCENIDKKLLDWELSISHEDYRDYDNDGTVYDYVVTLMSPDGDKYSVKDSHCAANGWEFEGIIKFN